MKTAASQSTKCEAVLFCSFKGDQKMKKLICAILLAALVLSLAACGEAPANNTSDDTYIVGICQLVQHEALDAATKGFKDVLTEKLGDKVKFIDQNASGDSATCITICNQFVAEGVDLMLANATPALQAAVASTDSIPIVGTSITDYATALEIQDWSGKTGKNITGAADLAPLDKQAAMIKELFPETKNVGIIYCSAEPNSVYQADVVEGYLSDMGINVKRYTFADTNDVASVVSTACVESDALYIPTDNTAATCGETINNVALPAGVPIITGDAGTCKGCGVATLSISYYDLGRISGEMAAEILMEGKNPGDMEIQFAPEAVPQYNAVNCAALGITPPENYAVLE